MRDYQKTIALFGTSADPPTLGHQALLEGLLTLFPKVITWASDNPKKKHIVSLNIRYSLLHTLVENIQNPHLEIKQELSSPWTISTIRKAKEKWPKSNIIFVIGSDLTEQISGWRDVSDIFKYARIAIAPRKGWPIQKEQLELLQSIGAEIDLLHLEIPATASSQIRHEFQINNIPPSLLPRLLKENLYDLNKSKQ